MNVKLTKYHMADASKFPRIAERDEMGISSPLAATIAFVVGVAGGVALMDTVVAHLDAKIKQKCADHRLPGFTGYALQTEKGYQCLMVPDKAQTWGFSPNIFIEKELK
jgi:hypothetical protein